VKPGHFKFEAKMMIWLAMALIGIAFIVGMVAPWFMHQLDVDRCLDAGGAYDYQISACVGIGRD